MGDPPRGLEQFMDGWSETGKKDKFMKKYFIYSKLIIVSSRYKLTGLL